MLLSVADGEIAILMVPDTINLHQRGGFDQTKWFANDMNIFKNINVVAADNRKNSKVLGLKWISDQDHLTIRRVLECDTKEKWTQRQVLSTVSQVLDQLGFLETFVIRGRLPLKRIWQTHGQRWDIAIAGDIKSEFNCWIKELMSQ